MTEAVARHYHRWVAADERERVLQVVQPALVGLIDGTVSTLAPIFASAYLAGSHTALFVGLATALGAGVSMGLSEALSDDGSLTGRGTGRTRGLITGVATFLGGTFHTLPFLISDVDKALIVAYCGRGDRARRDRLDPQALPARVAGLLAHPGHVRRRHRRRHRLPPRSGLGHSSPLLARTHG